MRIYMATLYRFDCRLIGGLVWHKGLTLVKIALFLNRSTALPWIFRAKTCKPDGTFIVCN
jgi:hypothetical protein